MTGEAAIMIEKYLIYWVMVTVNNSHISMTGEAVIMIEKYLIYW